MAETIKELRLFFRTAQTQIAIPHFGTQASSNLQQREVTYGWQNRFGVLIEEFNDLGGGIERPLIRFISGANDQLAIFARTKVAPMVFDEVDTGIGGALVKGPGSVPGETGSLIYLNGGTDLQTMLDKVESVGGRVILEKTKINDDSGFFALFIDSEGNKLALHSKK